MTTTDTTTATTDAASTAPVQVYRVYIKATPEAIWTAITDPEWTNRYGYTGYTHYDLRPGGALTVVPNEEFKGRAEPGFRAPTDHRRRGIEADRPELVTTWRLLRTRLWRAHGPTPSPTDRAFPQLLLAHRPPTSPNRRPGAMIARPRHPCRRGVPAWTSATSSRCWRPQIMRRLTDHETHPPPPHPSELSRCAP